MRKYLVFVVGVLALSAAGIYAWQRFIDYQQVLATWDNYVIANGFWLHPQHKSVKQTLFIQQYEVEVVRAAANLESGNRSVELKDLRQQDVVINLELPTHIAQDSAYDVKSGTTLSAAQVVRGFNRQGNSLRLLVATELAPQSQRFIESVNFLTLKPDAVLESVE